jgi:histidine kinase
VRTLGQCAPVILLTAERDATLRRQAAERGWGFLAKPVRPPALRA